MIHLTRLALVLFTIAALVPVVPIGAAPAQQAVASAESQAPELGSLPAESLKQPSTPAAVIDLPAFLASPALTALALEEIGSPTRCIDTGFPCAFDRDCFGVCGRFAHCVCVELTCAICG